MKNGGCIQIMGNKWKSGLQKKECELGRWVSNHQPSSSIKHPQVCRCLSPTLLQLPWPCGCWQSRRKAASPRSINNAHQLPGISSRLTPLELDANLQASLLGSAGVCWGWGSGSTLALMLLLFLDLFILSERLKEDVPAKSAGFPCPCMVVSCRFA